MAVIFLQLGTEKPGNPVLRNISGLRSLGNGPRHLRRWCVFGLRGVEERGRVCRGDHNWLRALETQL